MGEIRRGERSDVLLYASEMKTDWNALIHRFFPLWLSSSIMFALLTNKLWLSLILGLSVAGYLSWTTRQMIKVYQPSQQYQDE